MSWVLPSLKRTGIRSRSLITLTSKRIPGEKRKGWCYWNHWTPSPLEPVRLRTPPTTSESSPSDGPRFRVPWSPPFFLRLYVGLLFFTTSVPGNHVENKARVRVRVHRLSTPPAPGSQWTSWLWTTTSIQMTTESTSLYPSRPLPGPRPKESES